jgi:hypothetical protein
MDKLPELTARIASGQPLESSESLARAEHAATLAARLFSYYPPPDVGDPEEVLRGAVKIFLMYPREAVDAVCDPTRGLPSTLKWAPKLAEIRSALEEAMVPINWRLQQEQLAQQATAQIAERKPLQLTDGRERPTYDDLRAQCHAVGLMIGPKGSRMPPADPSATAKKYGLSRAQWDALPNRKIA